MPGIKPRTFYKVGKCSNTKPHTWPSPAVLIVWVMTAFGGRTTLMQLLTHFILIICLFLRLSLMYPKAGFKLIL